jgi:hypothetical protein
MPMEPWLAYFARYGRRLSFTNGMGMLRAWGKRLPWRKLAEGGLAEMQAAVLAFAELKPGTVQMTRFAGNIPFSPFAERKATMDSAGIDASVPQL